MKKTTILLGMLSLSFAYAQQQGGHTGKVGVNTNAPTETLDVNGTVKVNNLPTEGPSKIFNGQAAKNGTFTPKKTVVANEYGVLGVVEHIVESGDAAKTALKWDNDEKKWKAVTPGATSGNIYTVDGNIPANTTRTVTLDKGTGSGSGKLKFILPDGEQQSFNIVQGGNGDGFGLTRSGANNKNQVNFFDHDNTRLASVGFNGSDNIFRINNEKNENILLEDKVQIANIPADNTSTSILVEGANGLVSKRNVTDLLPAAQNDEAWKKAGTTNRITNAEDTSNIYRNTNVGIGDLSAADFQSSLHIRKANTASTVKKFATFQISDKQVTANDLQSTLEFTDSAGTKYAHIGDNSATEKTFDIATEKGYNLNLSTERNSDGDKTYIKLNADGANDAVRMSFYTGQWGSDPIREIAVTTVGANGNWFFGADAITTPADQKVVIGGALKFTGNAHANLRHNKVADSNAPAGTMFYNNNHFFGVVTEGGATKWKQLDNVDYRGTKGITVSGNTISLPDGGTTPTGTNKKALTWNGTTWEATEIPGTDNDTKSPWAQTGGTIPASNTDNTDSGKIHYQGKVGLGLGTDRNHDNKFTHKLNISGTNNQLSLQNGDNNWGFNVDSGALTFKKDTQNKFMFKNNGTLHIGTNVNGNDNNTTTTFKYDTSTKKLTLSGNDTNNNVALHLSGVNSSLRVDGLPDKQDATHVLVQGDNNVVSRRTVASLVPNYTGTKGITVSNGEISLPDGNANQVLTWNGNAWTAQNLPAAPTVNTLYTANGNINQNRTVTLGNNNSITWTGGNGFNIQRNAEALSIKPNSGNSSSYIGFRNNSTMVGYIGRPSTDSDDVVLATSKDNGKLKLQAGNQNGNGELEIDATPIKLTKEPADGNVATDKVLVRSTDGTVKKLAYASSPWVVAGTVATAGQGGTPATFEHNPRKYATGAYETANAKIFYSGKIGLNVGLSENEKNNWMPAALNISGTGEQLSLQSNNEAWGISAQNSNYVIDYRTLNNSASTAPNEKKFGISTNGNLAFGAVTFDSNNRLSVDNGVLYEHNHKKLSIKGTASGNVSLHTSRRVRIDEIPDKNDATHVLVQGDQGVVSRRAISSLTTAAAATEPWFVTGGTTQATNANNTAGNKNIYFKGGVGIGDFSSGGEAITSLGNSLDKQTVKLAVKGAVLAGSFKGAHGATIFPDYVFQKYYTGTSSIKADYTFQSLSQVEDFVKLTDTYLVTSQLQTSKLKVI